MTENTENFENLLVQSIKKIKNFEGTVVNGKVISIDHNHALIDVGLKSEGRISMDELRFCDKEKEINSLKYSFVHIDFDLYKPTLEVIQFIKSRLENNAIILIDDYNFINQEGVKCAVRDSGMNLNKSIQTQSGQLICWS